ncbi:hypothetical protein H2200_010715 [Cladophialophora chaetospira]|uniref:Uncharacterized protein n=1 Tax=Cladophialophora chaetospira TaxID=386627 RepID=A0AA38X0M6_9EURO|nr:hypothetical protein H2200_010715 [Cladophialophora chaetospira]
MSSISPLDFRSVLPIRSRSAMSVEKPSIKQEASIFEFPPEPPVVPVQKPGWSWTCGTFIEDMSSEPSTPIKQEVPTFTFALPDPQMPRPSPVKIEQGEESSLSDTRWSSSNGSVYPGQPPEPTRKPDHSYSAATMADFQRHMNVIDCRPIPWQPPTYTRPNAQPESTHATPPQNTALQDYQLQLMLLEQQKKKRDAMVRKDTDPKDRPSFFPRAEAHQSSKLEDYQMELMLIDRQKKKRDAVGQKDIDPKDRPSFLPRAEAHRSSKLEDYQMQLMLLDQHKRKREAMVRKDINPNERPLPLPDAQPCVPSKAEIHAHSTPGMHQTIARQRMQGNVAKQSQECHSGATSGRFETFQAPVAPRARARYSDYEMQLMLLEQQNRKRLMQARMEQENRNA